MLRTNIKKKYFPSTRLSLCVATALGTIGTAPVWAFNIDTGNPDIELRWDNTVRYNAGWRLEDVNPHFANSFGNDETETRFKKNDMILNRVDLLTEVDMTYQRRIGFRVSAAAWSENAYSSRSHTSDQINSSYTGPTAVYSNYGPSAEYTAYTKRYLTGSSGEFVDAFVFGNFDFGSSTLGVRLGQHNVYWGEALYTIADGVSAGQGPLDTIKGATSPGVEAKELFMPINQLSATWQLTDRLSVKGQYLFDWKPYRLVAGGTYFAGADGAGSPYAAGAPVCASVGSGGTCLVTLDPISPSRNGGDYGLALIWKPSWLDGNLGFYYRKYDEKLPWSVTQLQNNSPTLPNMGARLSFARDTELFGISLGQSVGPVSMGAEVSYRRNTALNSVAGFMAGSGGEAPATAAYFTSAAANMPLNQTPTYSQAEGARGNTYHALVNGIYLLPQNALWDAGSLTAEFAYQRLDKVTKNRNIFYSEDYACKFGYGPGGIGAGVRNLKDGCATKDSLTMNLGFTPQWSQVAPGLDLSMPTSYSRGLHGNSPTLGGATQGTYKWSIGLTATYLAVYEFAVAVTDSHVDYKTSPATVRTGVVGTNVLSTATASGSVQNNHRWLSLRFKTSF